MHAYKDPVGIWTIGFGSTKGVHPDMVITQDEAIKLLLDDVKYRADHMSQKIRTFVTNNEFCAMLSLAYNIGMGSFYGSTLLKKLNAKVEKHIVADEFLKWNHAGGKVLPGLTRRRKAERELFLKPDHIDDLGSVGVSIS